MNCPDCNGYGCQECGKCECISSMINKKQIHNIIFNSTQALFTRIGEDSDKLVHLEDWIEKWIDEYVEEKFK